LAAVVADTTRLTYIGLPAYASALAQELEAQGLTADYKPPYQTRDLATTMATVSLVFSVTGPASEIAACVRSFTSRFAGTRVEGLPAEQTQTMEERLSTLDRLRSENLISPEEHAEQRRRILNEL